MSEVDLPEIGGELRQLIATARYIGMRCDDVTPGGQIMGRLHLQRLIDLLARLIFSPNQVAYPQNFRFFRRHLVG